MKTDTQPIGAWRSYFARIEKYIETHGYGNIMQCHEILRAVCVGNAPHIRAKLKWLQSLPSYQSQFVDILQEDWIGGPIGLPVEQPFTSGTRINMLYHIIQLMNFGVNLLDFNGILEFGGGVGVLCEMLHRMGYDRDYTIYDVPVMNDIQKWFLGCHDIDALVTSELPKVSGTSYSPSAFIATMSFSEIPLNQRGEVEKLLPDYDLIFIAYAADFIGIDNVAYFKSFKKSLSQFKWTEWAIDRDIGITDKRKGKRYLVGVKE